MLKTIKNLLKVSIVLILMTGVSYGGLLNAISVIIDNQPITLYEINKYADKFHISTNKSLDILIRQKLEDAQIKKLNIKASDFEVDRYIKKLATKNGISVFDFFQMLKSKNIKENDYKNDVKKKIKQEKLYNKIYRAKKIDIKPGDLTNYYKTNKNQFVRAKSFQTVVYESLNRNSLIKIKNNPMLSLPDVKAKQIKFQSTKMDKALENLFDQTKSGEFTPVLKMSKSYTLFYIKEKNGVKTLPFAQVKNYIYSLLSSTKEKAAIDDYFEKIKSVAQVKVLRKPNN